MKIKKVLLIPRFSAQNFKVSVELWKSYIVSLGSGNRTHLLKFEPITKNLPWNCRNSILLHNIFSFRCSKSISESLGHQTISGKYHNSKKSQNDNENTIHFRSITLRISDIGNKSKNPEKCHGKASNSRSSGLWNQICNYIFSLCLRSEKGGKKL